MPNMLPVPAKIIEAIIGWEVSSRQHYERSLTRPTWPAVKSGVTIGIGYDLGYVTRDQFVRDWSPYLDEDEIETLLPCVGIKGAEAESMARRVANEVSIPWTAAQGVFRDVTIPRCASQTAAAFPGWESLPDECFGVLVSLVMNRGASMGALGDDRRKEMRLIRSAVASRDFGEIPQLLRGMKRLWPDARGLRDRRDEEAALFDEGLTAAHLAQLKNQFKADQDAARAAVIAGPSPVLRLGSSGKDVRDLQETLNRAGFPTKIDGEFGPRTRDRVIAFQRSMGLAPDGVAGIDTLATLLLA